MVVSNTIFVWLQKPRLKRRIACHALISDHKVLIPICDNESDFPKIVFLFKQRKGKPRFWISARERYERSYIDNSSSFHSHWMGSFSEHMDLCQIKYVYDCKCKLNYFQFMGMKMAVYSSCFFQFTRFQRVLHLLNKTFSRVPDGAHSRQR